MNVKVTGIPKVKGNLNKWEQIILKAAKKALIKGALVDVETGAKKKITQDGHIDTGRLRASIHTSYKGKETYSYSDNEGKSFTSRLDVRYKEYNVFVGTDVSYAVISIIAVLFRNEKVINWAKSVKTKLCWV
jgi:hypothetical protein